MNILRLLALSSITMLLISISASAHCAGKHGDNHPHCSGGGEDPSVVYAAELQGAFVIYPPLPVTLEGHDERLINDDPITIVSPAANAPALTTWNDVFYVCGLLQPVTEFTGSGGKKGWRIARPGGVYVQLPIPALPSNGYEDVKVTLQLIGDCAYSGGTEPCDPFPPDPNVSYGHGNGISKIPLAHFNIHARGEKGILHSLEICHSGSGALGVESILVITATEL